MIRLTGIGHVLLRVSDVERSKAFYSTVLGLQVTEQDPEHGGVFMALEGHAHSIDLFPVTNQDDSAPRPSGSLGLGHVAFRVSSEEALRDAYFTLEQHGVKVTRAIDHVSQKSVYFHDPDGNRVELYCDMVEHGFEAMRTLGPRRDAIDMESGEVVSRGEDIRR